MTPDTLTLDVKPADARDLRRRLQARTDVFTTAVLPGGAIVEDGPDALNYHFHVPGAWAVEEAGADLRLTNEAGHVLTVREGRIQLTLAK